MRWRGWQEAICAPPSFRVPSDSPPYRTFMIMNPSKRALPVARVHRSIEQRRIVIFRGVHPRGDRPHRHRLRWIGYEEVMRIPLWPEPALVGRRVQDGRHSIMNLLDQ